MYALPTFRKDPYFDYSPFVSLKKPGFWLFNSPHPGPVGLADIPGERLTHSPTCVPGRARHTGVGGVRWGGCCHFLVPAKSVQPLEKTSCFYSIPEMRTAGFALSSWISSSCHENISGPNFSMGSAGLSKKTFRYPGSCLLPIDGLFTQLLTAAAAFLGPGARPIAYLHRLCDKKVWVARKWDVCREKYSSPSGSEHVHLAEKQSFNKSKMFQEWRTESGFV